MNNNKSAKELIQELNETDETERLEAKAMADGAVGKSVYETICSMSNEPDLGGGVILLGVSKEVALFPFYSPTGVRDPDKISSDIASACATIFNSPVRVTIEPEKVSGVIVLKLIVSELPKASKPLYFKATGLPKGAFRRIGPSDVKCTDEDLSLFFQGQASSAFDASIIGDTSWSDVDPLAIKQYRAARAETYPNSESLTWSDQELLHALGAIRYVDEKIRLTVAGLLVFGQAQALRRHMPTHRVDYIRVPGNTWVSDPESPFQSIDMRGPILTVISRVIAAIADDLPKAYRIENDVSGQRTETPVIPLRVLREAVVN